MRILVIGAGAVSGYFGARLVQHGRDVTFLVRARRAEELRRGGLRVTGLLGDITVQPVLLTAEQLAASPQTFDLILLGVKAYSLAHAMEDFAPAVGPGTVILPLLNGMAHLRTLQARFSEATVLGGLTRVVAHLDSEGRIRVVENLHDLVFGPVNESEPAGTASSRIDEVAAALRGCGFEDRLSHNILEDMWFKWVLLSSTSAITLLARGTIGEINRAPGGRELALRIIAEASSLAKAEGHPLPAATAEIITERLTRTESAFVSSLYRDLHSGAPVEADHIFGDLLRRGSEHGVETPLLQAAYTQTKVYEARRV